MNCETCKNNVDQRGCIRVDAQPREITCAEEAYKKQCKKHRELPPLWSIIKVNNSKELYIILGWKNKDDEFPVLAHSSKGEYVRLTQKVALEAKNVNGEERKRKW